MKNTNLRPNDEETIHETLLLIGIPSNLKGFRYITYAEQMMADDPDLMFHVVDGLYRGIAIQFDTKPACVERAIRHAIAVAWTYGNLEFINELFRYSVNPNKGTPTNSQFISRLYFYLNAAQ